MNVTSIARNSPGTRWVLASFVLLGGLFGGYLAFDFFLDPPPDRPKPVAQLIRELHEQDTLVDKAWQDLWSKLHLGRKRLFLRFEPKPAAEVRLRACRALGQLRAETAQVVTALISALNDSDADVQRTAIQALGELGPMASAAQPELIRIFKTRANRPLPRKGELVCAEAAMALAKISPDDPLALHLLKEALLEKRPFAAASPVVVAAVSGLEKMAGAKPEVVSSLIAALPGSLDQLRTQIIGALGRIRQQPETVVPILIEALDFTADAQQAAIAALGDFGSEAAPAVPALIRLAQEARSARRSKQQAPLELSLGTDSTRYDRFRQSGLPTSALSIGSGDLGNIIATLGRIGRAAKEAIPFLVEDYADRANPFRFEEAFARWQIDGNAEAVAPVFLDGIRQPTYQAQMDVTRRLKEMGLAAVPILMTAFRDPDGHVRMAAIECLVKIKPTLLLEPALLQSGLNDPHLSVRLAVIQALGACGPEAIQAAPLLKPMLDDPKFVIRKVGGEALKKIQP